MGDKTYYPKTERCWEGGLERAEEEGKKMGKAFLVEEPIVN